MYSRVYPCLLCHATRVRKEMYTFINWNSICPDRHFVLTKEIKNNCRMGDTTTGGGGGGGGGVGK